MFGLSERRQSCSFLRLVASKVWGTRSVVVESTLFSSLALENGHRSLLMMWVEYITSIRLMRLTD